MKIENDYVRGLIAAGTILAFWGMNKAGISPAILTIL